MVVIMAMLDDVAVLIHVGVQMLAHWSSLLKILGFPQPDYPILLQNGQIVYAYSTINILDVTFQYSCIILQAKGDDTE